MTRDPRRPGPADEKQGRPEEVPGAWSAVDRDPGLAGPPVRDGRGQAAEWGSVRRPIDSRRYLGQQPPSPRLCLRGALDLLYRLEFQCLAPTRQVEKTRHAATGRGWHRGSVGSSEGRPGSTATQASRTYAGAVVDHWKTSRPYPPNDPRGDAGVMERPGLRGPLRRPAVPSTYSIRLVKIETSGRPAG